MLAPIVSGWLQLPREASTAFVMGLVRRDFGAAGLYELALTPHQVVALVTITLFVPCIASLMVMLKERGIMDRRIFDRWVCLSNINLKTDMTSPSSTSSAIHSLDEQLRREVCVCPRCRCKTTSPFITRCPRCLTMVPTQELGCTSSVHRTSCPVIPSSTAKSLWICFF